MITEVFFDMKVFIILFFIAHVAFAETFYYLSTKSDSEFVLFGSFFDAFRSSLFISLGTYDTGKFDMTVNEDGLTIFNKQQFLCWILMYAC